MDSVLFNFRFIEKFGQNCPSYPKTLNLPEKANFVRQHPAINAVIQSLMMDTVIDCVVLPSYSKPIIHSMDQGVLLNLRDLLLRDVKR